MSQDRFKPPYRVLSTNAVRSAAAALVQEAQGEQADRDERLQSEFFGQDAGVPGLGEPPQLVHEPGGAAISQRLLHPFFTIFERENRVLPEVGWFSPLLNPKRPVELQIKSFEVPKNTVLWLMDYQFQVFRPSGVDPGDFVVAAAGRFSNQIGFDVNISGGRRPSNISFQLDPQPAPSGRPEFEPPIGSVRRSSDAFNASAARTFASTASPGTSLLPRRPNVQGPRGGPFTFVVGQGASVSLNAVIFNALTSPIAAISGRMAGWLLHTNTSSALLNRLRPR